MNNNKLLSSSVRNVGTVLARALATKSQSKPQRRTQRRPQKRITNQALPAAYATHVRPRFTTRITGSGMEVRGCDLVYQIPADLSVVSDEELMAIIPANPAYWIGTRIAALAQGYQNYRPRRLTFHYIPQVAVTQAGTVIMGTLWNAAAPTAGLQQTLLTSNGGCMTQCYLPCDTTVVLGRNLQQNLFQFTGSLTLDTNPFTFAAIVRGSGDLPGYFYVTYDYEFRNPIGLSWTFMNSGIVPWSSITAASNTSIILAVPASGFGAGTILDMEGTQLYYHGTPVTVPENTLVLALSNTQTDQTAAKYQEVTSASRALTYKPTGSSLTSVDYIKYNGSTYTFVNSADILQSDYPLWLVADPLTSSDVSLYSGDTMVATLMNRTVISDSVIRLPESDVPQLI